VHVPNGTVVKGTELVRPMFGCAREGGVVKFDLVASTYLRGDRFARDQDVTQAVTGERSNPWADAVVKRHVSLLSFIRLWL
jgi:hypothetical protein